MKPFIIIAIFFLASFCLMAGSITINDRLDLAGSNTVSEEFDYTPAPRDFPQGIEASVIILQSITNEYGIGLIAADDGTVLTYIDHQSPRPDKEELDRRKAEAIAKHKSELARRQAVLDELDMTPQQIYRIKAYFDADIDSLFNNLNVNQRRFLEVQRALVRMLAKRELRELTDE
jgi:hypothetical protein